MPETVLSPGEAALNKTDPKSCLHGTSTVVGPRVRKSGSKAGSAVKQMDLSFLDDKTRGLEEVST